MADPSVEEPGAQRPPLGSWAAVYTLCCVLAVLVMAALYWFSQTFNIQG